MMPHRLTGRTAIDFARSRDLTLSKYTDPTEGARDGLSPAEASGIAMEDPGLIYLDTDEVCEMCVEMGSPDPGAGVDFVWIHRAFGTTECRDVRVCGSCRTHGGARDERDPECAACATSDGEDEVPEIIAPWTAGDLPWSLCWIGLAGGVEPAPGAGRLSGHGDRAEAVRAGRRLLVDHPEWWLQVVLEPSGQGEDVTAA